MDEKHIVFLKHLAKSLVEGVKKRFSDKILKSYFDRILQELPDGDSLKTSLVNNQSRCLQFFIKYVQKISAKEIGKKNQSVDLCDVDAESGATAEVGEDSHEDLGNTNKKHGKKSKKKKSTKFLVQHPLGVQALFVTQQLEKMTDLKKLSEFADVLMNSCTLDQDVDKYCRLIQLLAGTSDVTTLKKVVQLYLNELQPVTEEIVKNKSKEQAVKWVERLQRFLRLCHLKHPASDLGDDYPTYADLLASLLSLYLDLVLISHRDVEEKRSVCSFVCHLMAEVGTRLFDVVLQITAADQQNGALLLPLLRKIFLKKPKKSSPGNYLRYILAVRMWTNLLPVLQDVKAESRDIQAPKGFIHWLLKKNPALSEEIPTDHKFKGRLVTAFILDDADDNVHDLLLDALTTDSMSTEPEAGTSLLQGAGAQYEEGWPEVEAEVSEDEKADARDDIEEASEGKKDEEAMSYYSKILGEDSLFCIDRGTKTKPEVRVEFNKTADGEKTSGKERERSIVDDSNLNIMEEKVEVHEDEAEIEGKESGDDILFSIDEGSEMNNETETKQDRTPLRKKKKQSIDGMTDSMSIANEAVEVFEVEREETVGEESLEVSGVPDGVEQVFCIDRSARRRSEVPTEVENATNKDEPSTPVKKSTSAKGRMIDKADPSVEEADVKVCERELQEGKEDGKESSGIEIPVDEEVSFVIDRGMKARQGASVDPGKSAFKTKASMVDETDVAQNAKDKDIVVPELIEGTKKCSENGKVMQEGLNLLSSEIGLDIGGSFDGDLNKLVEDDEGVKKRVTNEDNVVDEKDERVPKMEGDETAEANSEKFNEGPKTPLFCIDGGSKTVCESGTELGKVTDEGKRRQKTRKAMGEVVGKFLMDVVEDGLNKLGLNAEEQEVSTQGNVRRMKVDTLIIDLDPEDEVMIEDGDFVQSSLGTDDQRIEVLSDASEPLLGPVDTLLQVDEGSTIQRTEQNKGSPTGGKMVATSRDEHEDMHSDISAEKIELGPENSKTVQSSRKSMLSVKKRQQRLSRMTDTMCSSSPENLNVEVSRLPGVQKCNFDPDKGVVWSLPGADHKPSSPETLENTGASSQSVEVGCEPVNGDRGEEGIKLHSVGGGSPSSNLLTPSRKRKSSSGKDEESEVCRNFTPTESQKTKALSTKKSAGSLKAGTSPKKASGFAEELSSTPVRKKVTSIDAPKTVNCESAEKDTLGSCKKTPDSKAKSVTPVSRRTRGQKRLQGETPLTTGKQHNVINTMSSGQLYENSIMTPSEKSGRVSMEQSAVKKKRVSHKSVSGRPSVSERIEEVRPRSNGSSEDGEMDFTELRKTPRDIGAIETPLAVTPPKKAKLSEPGVSVKSTRKANKPDKRQTVCLDLEQGEECSSSPGKSPLEGRSKSALSEQKSKVQHPEPSETATPSKKDVVHDIMTRSKLKGYNLRVHPK